MNQNKYEIVFITHPDIANDQVDQLLAKLKQIIANHKGTITAEDRWGRRRMAYPIEGHREGFYVVLNCTAEPAVIADVERYFNVTDAVIRHIMIRIIQKSKKFAPRRVSTGRPGATAARPRSDSNYRPSSPSSTATPAAATSASAPAPTPAAPETPSTAS